MKMIKAYEPGMKVHIDKNGLIWLLWGSSWINHPDWTFNNLHKAIAEERLKK